MMRSLRRIATRYVAPNPLGRSYAEILGSAADPRTVGQQRAEARIASPSRACLASWFMRRRPFRASSPRCCDWPSPCSPSIALPVLLGVFCIGGLAPLPTAAEVFTVNISFN